MAQPRFDRAAEDIGNIVGLGHVNTAIPRQRLSTLFYVTGLGLTRDPFINTGIDNMWINVGQSQFHLPTGRIEVLRGITGLVLPDRAALLERLAAVRAPLAGTGFDFRERNDCVETVSPWGNRIHCHAPDPERFGPLMLGMPYVQFDVRPGTAEGIARFYREVLAAPAELIDDAGGRRARVMVGAKQYFVFRETDAPEPAFDGHHVQIDVADFSGPHRRLQELRPHHRGEQPAPVPLQGHRRSRYAARAVHHRARGAQHAAPDVCPRAGQPQSGADRHELPARPRQPALVDGIDGAVEDARSSRAIP